LDLVFAIVRVQRRAPVVRDDEHQPPTR